MSPLWKNRHAVAKGYLAGCLRPQSMGAEAPDGGLEAMPVS